MRRLTTYLAAVAGLATAATLTVAPAVAASASTVPLPTARGHVALAGPLQYVRFAAHTRTSNHGWVDYSNFEFAASGTNVWNISKADSLTFSVGGTDYAHTIKTLSLKALSPEATAFSGTGQYNGSPFSGWTIKGVVYFNRLAFYILYTSGANVGYHVSGTGLIAPNGSASGTATDSNGATLAFKMPAGSAFQVLHYRTGLTCAVIGFVNARIGFTIPSTAPAGLAGLRIVAKVHDGGPGFTFDRYGHGLRTSWCNSTTITRYPITSGNIFVHR